MRGSGGDPSERDTISINSVGRRAANTGGDARLKRRGSVFVDPALGLALGLDLRERLVRRLGGREVGARGVSVEVASSIRSSVFEPRTTVERETPRRDPIRSTPENARAGSTRAPRRRVRPRYRRRGVYGRRIRGRGRTMAAVCVRARGLLRVESDPRFDRPRSNGSILDESEQRQPKG